MRIKLFFALFIAAVFFTACDSQPEAVITESGYRFYNHTNKGGVIPKPEDDVLIQNYVYIKDSLMVSTQRNFGGPQKFTLVTREQQGPGRAPAMYEAVLLMGKGDSATIYETIDSSDRKYVPQSLQDATEVRYEIVLLDVTTKAEKEKIMAEMKEKLPVVQSKMQPLVQDYVSGNLAGKLTLLDSGLQLKIEDKGSGKPIAMGEEVEVHYYGTLTSGEMFDNSFERGEPLKFPVGVGQMIPGFDEGVQQLNHGGKAYLFIPAKLGYGEQSSGKIPANSELIFYIEVL